MNAHTSPSVSDLRSPEEVMVAFVRLRGCSRQDLVDGHNRTRPITRARHELWWLLRDLTTISYAEIGQMFDGRDPSTIIGGVNGVADLIAGSPDYRAQMQQMRQFVLSHAARDSDPKLDAAMVLARRVLIDAALHPDDIRALALSMVSVAAVLRAVELTDGEARLAAMTIIRNGGRATHGN
jgi:hypothetical protein